ncbi:MULTISPECIES: ABC transporter ATP-binding protein [Erwinia]|uniref:ABC-type xenobiotic transporter n=1 Tax=Erwinia rhapontici TaxID=55212 RepID=A0ABM7N5C6_ERWRD|nr:MULTISPECIES: ABC transporter ATP-binding protein [Erwinia]NNS08054.1 ABC transporter ATP-binding protein [Erwinia sp. JH02]TDT00592.1 ATP-binding cassette subfamily B protein [Erwinia rhapontici]BCQ36665.1 ABC transporter permease [Erwinia rhapontici]BCQ41663.1 ABC transporter permease [Erwinia rhapontici]BCQ46974.1 ABC transporter permease [Erwinia rhapontici]
MNHSDRSLPQLYQRLIKAAGSQSAALRRSFLLLLLAAAAQGLALACLFPLLAALFNHSAPADSLLWLAVMSALSLLTLTLRWFGQGFEYNGQMAAATHEIRMALGQQLRRMPLEHLQQQRTGEVSALLLGNVDENLNYTVAIANLIMLATVTPLVVMLTLLAIDWRLSLMLLLVFAAIAWLYRRRNPHQRAAMQALDQAQQAAHADIVDYVQGLALLRTSCCHAEKAQRLQQSLRQVEQVQTAAHRQGAASQVAIGSVVEIGLIALVMITVHQVVSGTLDLSVLAALVVIMVRFSEPMTTLLGYATIVELIATALQRIEALLAVEPLPVHQPAATPQDATIRIDNLSFQYAQGNAPALQAISLTLAANSMTALVGPSGSGKTTLSQLIMRYADPQQGSITLGGADIRHIPARTLYQQIAVVFQDVYLFDDTLFNNIRMARPDAHEDEIEDAARKAHCLDFIERLPQGWQTRMGERGGHLSGGERQRISLARALLKNAPVVILDEPTAALDTESERAVQRAIDHLVQNKTVLVIAHRLSTIAAADHIVVLEQGRVAEQGKHSDLLQKGGRYCALWQAQQAVKRWGNRA